MPGIIGEDDKALMAMVSAPASRPHEGQKRPDVVVVRRLQGRHVSASQCP
jgi:hypothetical protein